MSQYTDADQRSDRSFLVGVQYGRESERERIAKAIEALPTWLDPLLNEDVRLVALSAAAATARSAS